jgi:hypothetical protein
MRQATELDDCASTLRSNLFMADVVSTGECGWWLVSDITVPRWAWLHG